MTKLESSGFLTFKYRKLEHIQFELFDKVTNVREPYSVFHNLKLVRVFFGWWKVPSMSSFWTDQETYYLHLEHPRQWKSGIRHMAGIVMCIVRSAVQNILGMEPANLDSATSCPLVSCIDVPALSLVLHGCTSKF